MKSVKAVVVISTVLSFCALLLFGAGPASARMSDTAGTSSKVWSKAAALQRPRWGKPRPTVTATPTPGPTPTPAAAAKLAVGVQYTAMWNNVTDADQKAMAAAIAQSGSKWARLDVAWATIQPNGPGSFDLAWGVPKVDRAVNNAVSAGLNVVLTFYWAPEWATVGTGKAAHPDPAAYATAAKWVAARYKGKVQAIEVWNEQNGKRFWNPADPVAYTQLLKAAYPAIKAGSPETLVVMGGLEYSDTSFLQKMYAAGAKGSYDISAFHPYPAIADQSPYSPWDGTKWTIANMAEWMRVMRANGDSSPVWLTEFGWATHENWDGVENWNRGVTEAAQAQRLTDMFALVADQYPQVTGMFWYTIKDTDLGNIQQDSYGLLRKDGTRKPAFEALRRANQTYGVP
ncbi:cellulase family glycosylhydrolase [uncultured Phycicoccus sp.]|uniref:cellulase family glycosylhydrolase n=1 Tax=uncultured Phycicoccus sp. TaxID=661422 RepID=UPI002615250D|nr:cellulase family glycosylhydrolase [uncultured Phycicoccus sp.]